MSDQTVLKAEPETREVGTGLKSRDTGPLAKHLSHALADSYVLYLNTHGAHWNVVGPLFYSLHKLTEEQYEDLAGAVDEIAERIRAIGHIAPSCFSEFSELAAIESVAMKGSAEDMIETLARDNERVADRLRQSVAAADEVEDVYTADLLTSRVGAHEEAAWMLRAILEK